MPAEVYAPYEPLLVPKPFAPEVWVVDGPEIRFGYAGLKVPFPTRMTLVRLDGALWVHSPVALTEPLARSVCDLGEVRWLVAPNTIHYWWLPDWAERFPHARRFAPPGLARSAKRPLPSCEVLDDAAPADWAGRIDQLLVSGDVLTEAVFFHRASRTLVLTDLIENFEPSRIANPLWRGLMRLAGAADPDGKAPLDMQLSFLRARPRLRAQVKRMIDWAPERIVLAHGRCYSADGAGELRRAFRWVL